VDPGTKLSDQDYRTVGMDGFSALAIGSNGRSCGVVANSAAPRPSGTLVTVEAYCGPRRPRNVLTLEKRSRGERFVHGPSARVLRTVRVSFEGIETWKPRSARALLSEERVWHVALYGGVDAPLSGVSHPRPPSGKAMETLLTVWSVFACTVLIWNSLLDNDRDLLPRAPDGTSKPRLDYIVISPAWLSEWEGQQSNLIVIDLRAKTDRGRDPDAISGALSIPLGLLAIQLCWIPPGTRLVFYEQDRVDHFDRAVEDTLLGAGIHAVYPLGGGIEAWHAHVARGQNRALPHSGSTPASFRGGAGGPGVHLPALAKK
jgi:rhodanese-related sulfurtransferase